jgi:hypothetical protein
MAAFVDLRTAAAAAAAAQRAKDTYTNVSKRQALTTPVM